MLDRKRSSKYPATLNVNIELELKSKRFGFTNFVRVRFAGTAEAIGLATTLSINNRIKKERYQLIQFDNSRTSVIV